MYADTLYYPLFFSLLSKVSMNSIYGACGATDTGKYPDLAVSATVTLQGRTAMVIKKEILPQRFPGIDGTRRVKKRKLVLSSRHKFTFLSFYYFIPFPQ